MKRILVIATRQIGDVLLTTPLVRAARERWPQARIDVLGFAGGDAPGEIRAERQGRVGAYMAVIDPLIEV